MAINQNFYKEMTSFQKIRAAFDDRNYLELPADWFILVTDIKNSTIAVTEGKYKEVNMAGVLSIISVKNALHDESIPFVFGGDGATLAVPQASIQNALEALKVCQQRVHQEFNLHLRYGSIQYVELQKQGFKVEIAKFELSKGNEIAMLRGSGLAEAENKIKVSMNEQTIANSAVSTTFEGLECRWNPIPTKRGQFLSVIIQPASPNDTSVLSATAEKIFSIMQSELSLDFDQLPKTWPPIHLKQEIKIRFGNGIQAFIRITIAYAWTFLVSKLIKNVKKDSDNGGSRYLNQLITNTDHFKIEGSLKFVIDTNREERDQIIAMLDQAQREKKIFFGFNESQFAVITCFVRSITNHIHFIDGGNGGYTKASVMLKSQKSRH